MYATEPDAKSLFFEAVENVPPAEWTAFLDRRCLGDADLRRDVAGLLRAHAAADSLFDAEPPDATLHWPPTELPAGTQIGPYKLREQIGEGGFGVVYVAEQEHPVARKVALKIIKPGMDTKEVIARFEAERQALALMDHPNIAKVLDAGTTGGNPKSGAGSSKSETRNPKEIQSRKSKSKKRGNEGALEIRNSDLELPSDFAAVEFEQWRDSDFRPQGRPYFVMELVRGVPITEFCDERKLNTRERLALFIDVCRAVQHAHQKGIIHRDLKPSNVMVTLHDDKPVVKVIDFGVSKALSSKLTDKSIYTAYGQMVGTPLYMSPEQAQLSGLDVDTRSDVYSLGVLLYELLTGTTPFDKETLQKSGFDEMRRIIREVEPPRPSVRVSTLRADVLTTVCDQRRVDPRRIRQHLRGELDWVVMKALEKDRHRRYQSAADFAEDIERFLACQPVEACPPSRLYRFRKFARRNRAMLATLVGIALALLAGTGVATWQAVEAFDARDLADDRLRNEIAARKEADKQTKAATASAELSRRLLYTADMRIAGDAYRRNDVTLLRQILSRHVPAAGEEDLRGFEWHFLWKQTGMKSREILQANGPLYFVCYSRDGKWLATAGKDAVIRILDGSTLTTKQTISSGQKEVNGLVFSPDGTRLASAGDDGTIAIWNTTTGMRVKRFTAHPDLAYQVGYSRDGRSLVSCGNDPIIRIWDPVTGLSIGTLQRHSDAIECISISSSDVLVAGSHDGSVATFDLKTRKRLSYLRPRQSGVVTSVSFSSSGTRFAHGQENGSLSIVDAARKAHAVWQTLPQGLQCLAFSKSARTAVGDPTANWIAVGDREGNIHLLPVGIDTHDSGLVPSEAMELRTRQWSAHAGRVYSIAVSPDSNHIVSAGADGKLLVWMIGKSPGYRRIDAKVRRFAFLDSNRLLMSVAGRRGLASVVLKQTGSRPRWWPVKLPNDFNVYVAPRSGDVFALDGFGRAVYRIYRNRLDAELDWDAGKENQRVTTFSLSPGGKKFVCCIESKSRNIEFVLFDRIARREILRRKCDLMSIQFSPNGRQVAFDKLNAVHILDASTGKTIVILSPHKTSINDLQFSPDGIFIASVSKDRTLKVWNWRTKRLIFSTFAHHNSADSLSFSPDGRTIATVGRDGMLRLWRWRLGRLLIEFPLQEWPVIRVRFSPDGRRIVVRHVHGSLQIYDGSPVTAEAAATQPAGNAAAKHPPAASQETAPIRN